jgi:hypothetical protein
LFNYINPKEKIYWNIKLKKYTIKQWVFINFDWKIYFDKYKKNRAYCYLNSNYSLLIDNHKIIKTLKILKAICFINRKIDNFNNFNFPKAFS